MSEEFMKRAAKPMLFAAAFIWGSSFFIMKDALDDLPVQYLLAIRFTTGAVLLGIICWKKWREFTPDYFWRGAIAGLFLYLGYSIQTYGLIWTTPSKNAFLTSVYCVMVPFLYWLISRIRPDRYNIISAMLCVAGVGLVSLNGDLRVNIGDALTLLCAIFYALHIVAVAKVSRGKDIYLLTIFQFAFAALFAWTGGLIFEEFPAAALGRVEVLLPLAYLSVMATTVALLFQNVGLVWSAPAPAAIILSLESVFGVLCSALLAGDQVSVRMGTGFALIFAAVICSETKLEFLRAGANRNEAEDNRE